MSDIGSNYSLSLSIRETPCFNKNADKFERKISSSMERLNFFSIWSGKEETQENIRASNMVNKTM